MQFVRPHVRRTRIVRIAALIAAPLAVALIVPAGASLAGPQNAPKKPAVIKTLLRQQAGISVTDASLEKSWDKIRYSPDAGLALALSPLFPKAAAKTFTP